MQVELQPVSAYQYSDDIAKRVRHTLALFPNLPDDALVDVRLVSIILNRSIASVWRDAKQGRLASPVHVGARSARWRVGDVRAALRGENGNVA